MMNECVKILKLKIYQILIFYFFEINSKMLYQRVHNENFLLKNLE